MICKNDTWKKDDEIDCDGYYRHGECGQILFRVTKDTNVSGVYCHCKKCRTEIPIKNIQNGQIVNTTDLKRIKMA